MIFLLCVWAQAAQSLDYPTAQTRVLELGVDSVVAEAALKQAESAVMARQRAWNPDLSYGLGLRASLNTNGLTPIGTAGLQSTLPIYSGGANRELLVQAQAAEKEAAASINTEHQQVLWDLAAGLWVVQEAYAVVDVEKKQVENAQATLSRIQALVEAGARTRADQLQEEANLAEAEANVIAATQAARAAELALYVLLRLDPLEEWILPVPTGFPAISGSPSDLQARALSQRPEISAAQAAVEQAVSAIEQEKAGLRPQLNGSMAVDTSINPLDSTTASAQLSAGLSLTGAVFDRGGTQSGRLRSEAALTIAQAQLEQLKWAITAQVQQALSQRQSALALQAAAARRVLAAQEALTLTDARYVAGAALYTELSAARLSVVQAQRAQVAAQTAVAQAELELRWAIGEHF